MSECTLTKDDIKRIPFTLYDAGWVILCIGMAIGAGIVFLPIQIGIKGIWVFIVSIIIVYPGIYLLQDIYLKTLSRTEDAKDYTSIISQYLGPNWAIFMSIIYFLMLFKGIFNYSLAVTFDSASFLQTFGITDGLMSDHFWWGLLVISVLVALASQGEKLIFKISTPMVLVKLGIVLLIGIAMIPHWNFSNISALPNMGSFIRDLFLTMPFTLFSILFMQILSPVNIAYRKIESNRRIATYRAIRVNRIAYAILAISILFFAFSFTFTLNHEQAMLAYKQNITALALAAKVLPGSLIKIMTVLLNIFAILTAFLGIYLGFQDALKGIVRNIVTRFIPVEKINERFLSVFVCAFSVISLWCLVMTRMSIILLNQLSAPLYGIVGCLIPGYLIYKVSLLHDLKGMAVYYIIGIGLMLCFSPLFILFD
ncbi:amino acid permease [Salmonella enterica subsp. enterica serovar Derby]